MARLGATGACQDQPEPEWVRRQAGEGLNPSTASYWLGPFSSQPTDLSLPWGFLGRNEMVL